MLTLRRCLHFKEQLKKHQKRFTHRYCGGFKRPLDSLSCLASHRQSAQHATEFRCCDCGRGFKSSGALDDHLHGKNHSKPVKKSVPPRLVKARVIHPCPKCPRRFATPNALRTHRETLAHCPIDNMQCITSMYRNKFRIPSALLHHLESGLSPSGFRREALRSLVLEHDTDRLISDSARTLGTALTVLALTPSSTLSEEACRTPDTTEMSDWALLVSQRTRNRCIFLSAKASSL